MQSRASLGDRLFDWCNAAVLLMLSAVMVLPFVHLVALSLNDGLDTAKGGIYLWPRQWSLSAYELLFQNRQMAVGFGWSLLRVAVGTITCLFATGLLAYLTTIRQFSGRRLLRILFFLTMYFGGGLIPTYLLMVHLGLINSFHVYWLPSLFNAFYMLLIASYIQNLPEAMFESARMDGAGELRIYTQLIVPVSLPVLAAVSIYSAVGHWNAWFDVVLYNSSGGYDTLQVILRRILLESEGLREIQDQQLLNEKFRRMTPVNLRAATTVVVTLPILLVYPFLQKYFIGGITLGSVKG